MGCSSELLNGSMSTPSVVVPSGKIATTSPAASTAATRWFTRRVSRRCVRSMNNVPAPRIMAPMTGHRASSDFATKRTGCTEFSTKMSSQEMWLATISTLPPRAPMSPCSLASTARIRSRRRLQRLTSQRLRAGDTSGKTNSVVATPEPTCTHVRT